MATEPAGSPSVSVVIPTLNRGQHLPHAVASVLAQTVEDLEVVVVDDGSDPPVDAASVSSDPRVRVVRHESNRGLAAALNTGVREARGRFVAHLDDDDRLLPRFLELSLAALEAESGSDGPVLVVSGVETVDPDGTVVDRRLPPTRQAGAHWSLEPLEPGLAYEVRNTMVAERSLLLDVGLFDEAMRSSIRNDLFLRLNPRCRILGIGEVTYLHCRHPGERISENPSGKHESFRHLERKHRALYRSHPERYAAYLLIDARRLRAGGRRWAALVPVAKVLRYRPSEVVAIVRRRLGGR
jgi:glycosyltransferase involved in cell wall biosynthesis